MTESWRTSPFVKGTQYRVKRRFQSLGEVFEEGELLTYLKSAYTTYNSITGFIFKDQMDNFRVWDLPDDQPLESWKSHFEPVLIEPKAQ